MHGVPRGLRAHGGGAAEVRAPRRQGAGKLHRAKGCPACSHTGYRGRTGIYELLLIDADVRSLLVGRPSLEHVRRAAARQGMKTLRQAAILKAVEGVTTLDEVDRVIADEAVQGGRP